MNIILLGMPGSGKGTQAKLLAKKLGLFYFEAGYFSRELAEINSRIKTLVEKGELIPEEEMTRHVSEHLEENVNDFNNMLFDGYPRFVSQYKFVEKWIQGKGGQIDKVVVISVSEEEIVKRLSVRRTCIKCGSVYNLITNPPPGDKCECGGDLVQREDDMPEAIKERFKWFRDNTQPMIDYVKKVSAEKIIEVNGQRPIQVIHENILERIGANAKD